MERLDGAIEIELVYPQLEYGRNGRERNNREQKRRRK